LIFIPGFLSGIREFLGVAVKKYFLLADFTASSIWGKKFFFTEL
jgi:hypothetical protein